MSVAYVDSSALVAVAFEEPGSSAVVHRLEGYSRNLSSNLLEAELRAAHARENVPFEKRIVAGIDWVIPDRPLSAEFRTVLDTGYIRGADLWHLATALYTVDEPASISFITLDASQRNIAKRLGFRI